MIAVIGTFYNRPDAVAPIAAAINAQTRQPDEVWCLWEGDERVRRRLRKHLPQAKVVKLVTPMNGTRYAEIPYSRKINYALDRTSADYIVYVTDDSLPHPDKYRRMADALDAHPEWGAVYCAQEYDRGIRGGDEPIEDAYCVLDHTQVMHRRTEDRWPLEVRDIRIGDAIFWRRLHASLGPFHPIPDVLDTVRQQPDGISANFS